MLKCPMCGSASFKRQGGKCICKYCGFKADENELAEVRRAEEKAAEKYISETDSLFSKDFISEVKAELSNLEFRIDATFLKRFSDMEQLFSEEQEKNKRIMTQRIDEMSRLASDKYDEKNRAISERLDEINRLISDKSDQSGCAASKGADESCRNPKITSEDLETARENLDYLKEVALLHGNVGDDVRKTVEHFLAMNPPQYQAATAMIRLCIENYARYKLGVDLNEKFLFPKQKTSNASRESNAKEIFEYLGESPQVAYELYGIYKSCHSGVHGSISFNINKKDIMGFVKVLEDNGIDRVDKKTGVPRFYSVSDRLLKERVDEGCYPENFNLNCFFKNREDLKEYMNSNGIEIPKVNFPDKATYDAYLSQKASGAETQAPPETPEPDVSCPIAVSGDEERFSGKIVTYKNDLFGFVKNALYPQNLYFQTKDLRDNSQKELVRVGATANYKIGQGRQGAPVAIDIIIEE